MIRSDWHIHTVASYDGKLPPAVLVEAARAQGLEGLGFTDHVNFNDPPFRENIAHSRRLYEEYAPLFPGLRFGVELTPVQQPLYDYIAAHGSREGYADVPGAGPMPLNLGLTLEELRALGVSYVIGAAHWRLDAPDPNDPLAQGREAYVREWFRQQMFLVTDPRVTVLGHPWYVAPKKFQTSQGPGIGRLWYEDFRIIPRSMHDEMAAAMLENGVAVECNRSFMFSAASDPDFRRQYAEYLRYLFEKGVPVTYGSDSHGKDNPTPDYPDHRAEAERILEAAGFRDGDFSTPPELF